MPHDLETSSAPATARVESHAVRTDVSAIEPVGQLEQPFAGPPGLAPPPGGRIPPADVLRLQRLVGNQAVATLIRRSSSEGASRGIGPEGGRVDDDVSQRISAQRGSGEPLGEGVRTTMETSLGADFSSVRVHTGAESAVLNAELGARAFTTGNDIFLGRSTSQADQSVLAHELTHVVQQQSQSASANGPLTVGRADDPLEQAADRVAHNALAGASAGSAGPTAAADAVVQRHPAGAGMSIDQDAATAELADPPPLGQIDGGAPEPGAAQAAPPTPVGAGPDGAPPAAGGTPGPPAKAPASPPAMDLSKAQSVLDKSYGGIHKIVPGTITFVEGQAALWAKYDEVCLRDKCTNPHTKQPWKAGDAQHDIPGLQGFADKGTGTVYVNHFNPLPTATAHEMLHMNTASGFRAAVGETINEGMTERLALRALTAAGISTAGTGGAQAYPMQRDAVDALSALVGEENLVDAYFNGAATSISTFEALQGKSTWAAFKTAMEGLNKAVYEPLLKPPTTQQRIAIINALLDAGAGADLGLIANIVRTPGTDLDALQTALKPRIEAMTDAALRTQLLRILHISELGDFEAPEPPAGPGSAYA